MKRRIKDESRFLVWTTGMLRAAISRGELTVGEQVWGRGGDYQKFGFGDIEFEMPLDIQVEMASRQLGK